MQIDNIYVELCPSFPFKKKRKISTKLALGHKASYWQNWNLNIAVPDSQCCAYSSGSCCLSKQVSSEKWSYNARVVDPLVVTRSLKQFLFVKGDLQRRKNWACAPFSVSLQNRGLKVLFLIIFLNIFWSSAWFFFFFPLFS